MKRVALLVLATAVVAAASQFGGSVCAGQTLTYVDLVKRLTDLERLATLPLPGEKCAQCSSYDRASRYDAATGKYVQWDANGDGEGIIRREGNTEVLAEMEGPGCIWRIWSALPQAGHVRIYLDGAAAAAVDLAFEDYFNGKSQPFVYPALVYKTSANGMNSYVPIPYQKSCKIVGDKGWGKYYHFTYGTFPPGTKVPTFQRRLGAEESAALAAANRILETCGVDPAGKRDREEISRVNVVVQPGKTVKVLALHGSQAITAIRMKLDVPRAPKDYDYLRTLALQITWDGQSAPAVWSPLGDFFGTAPGANKYSSLPLGLKADGGWYSFWYMPFEKGAVVELTNDGAIAREVCCEITHAPLSKPVAALGRFHAKWHRDAFLPVEPERKIDWTMLKTTGRGRFCGVMLHVWNPCGDWWGEGDEKFFVDGEKFPSTFGTGSEDYFGYAWSCGKLFFQAFHNQTRNDGDNFGNLSVNRWQVADNVPFQTSFEGAIEKYFLNQRPTQYSAVAYWYQAAGQADPYVPAPVAQRIEGSYPQPYKVQYAQEGEFLRILEKTGGGTRRQDMTEFHGRWSYGQQLLWGATKVGDRITLAVPVKHSGRSAITLQLTKAPDYGVVQAYWDGRKIGEPIDCYRAEVGLTGESQLGVQEVPAGDHKLTLEIIGTNKDSRGCILGLDYVRVVPESN